MSLIGGELGYRMLRRLGGQGENDPLSGNAYEETSKLEILLGADFFSRLPGKTIIEFGCGTGEDAIAMAKRGAGRIIGVDIRERMLDECRENAAAAGVSHICEFTRHTDQKADMIVTVDAFEHFDDPRGVLEQMFDMLEPGGEVIGSFGCTWYHPYGGHLFSVFPWAHLIFTEEALIRWRNDFKTDGATRFNEVEGGLNQMTISRFERLVDESRLTMAELELVPIRKLRWLHSPVTREFTTSVVRCRLTRHAEEHLQAPAAWPGQQLYSG